MFLAMLALIAVVPLVFWPGLFGVFSLAKSTLFQLILAVMLLYVGVTGVGLGRGRRQPVDVLFIGLAVLVLVSTLLSEDRATAVFGRYGRYEGLITYAGFFTVSYLAAGIEWSADRLRRLFVVIAATGTLAAIYGLLQVAGIDPFNWSEVRFEAGRAFSTFGNPILFASYLALILPVAFVLMGEDDRRTKVLGIVATISIILALGATVTRAGWIAGFVGIALLLFLQGRRRILAALTVGIIVVIVLTMTVLPRMSLGNEFSKAFLSRRGSIDERIETWRITLPVVAERPLFGHGPDTFRSAFSPHDTESRVALVGGSMLVDNAHSYPLQLAATLGVPAVVVFFTLVLLVLTVALARERQIAETRYVTGLVVAVIAYLVSLLFTVDTLGSGLVFWIFLGILRGSTIDIAPRARFKGAVPYAIGPAIVFAAVLVVLALTRAGADSLYLKAKNANLAGSNPRAIELFERAVQLNPIEGAYWQDYGLLQLNKALATGSADDFAKADRIFEALVTVAPGSTDSWMLRGQARLFAGQRGDPALLTEARLDLERALELWPQSAPAYYLLGETHLSLNEPDAAVVWLERAVGIKSEFPEARQALSEARSLAGTGSGSPETSEE